MKKDWILFADIILIIGIGFVTLYSTVVGSENIFAGGGTVNRQLIFILLGLVFYFAFTRFDYRFTANAQMIIPIIVISIIGLALLLIFGVEINYAKRWIILGGFRLQVSEFAKLAVIMSTAWLMSLEHKYNSWSLAGISLIPAVMISGLIFLEPDASTSVIILLLWAIIAFTALPYQRRNFGVAGISALVGILTLFLFNGDFLYAGIAAGMLMISAIAFLLIFKRSRILLLVALVFGGVFMTGAKLTWDKAIRGYQMDRIECFLNPDDEENWDKCFNIRQAKVAFGSGMILGKGFGHGTQSKLQFLPEHQTDFVFAAFGEEFGLLGSLFVLGLYAFAVFRILYISSQVENKYGSLLCVGIAIKLLLEVFVNIGTNLGVVPATGIPLPLMSAGGSMFLVTMISLGMVQSVRTHTDESLVGNSALDAQ